MKKRSIITVPKDTEVTGTLLAQLIADNEANRSIYTKLESYVDDEPQIDRTTPNDLLTINNFAEYITRINVGYLLGQPVDYNVPDESKNDSDLAKITDQYEVQHIPHTDSQLGQDCSMFGRAFEVVYVDEDSNPQSAKLDVYGTIVVYDNTYKHRKLFAINYAQKTDDKGKALDGQYDVTLWDKLGIYQYDLNKETLTENDFQQHFFGRVPVIEYFNDARLKGDYENVITLIDAYNILQSDRVIDREKLVDAILAIQKAQLTQEDMQNIKDNRVMGLPEGAKAEYIIKQVNEADADVLRKVLAADIHKFSMTPDMSSDEFGGNGSASTSGVALKYRLLPFENKAKDKQQYFEDGLQRRLELYSDYLKLRRIVSKPFNPSDIEIVFKRSLPQNDLETSQMITNLDGLVDRTTLAGQLSFVKDASQVVDEAEAEDKALGNANFGTGKPTEPAGVANGAPQAN